MPSSKKSEAEIRREDRRLLQQARLRSFTVTPSTVNPFEEAELEWEITYNPSLLTTYLNDKQVNKAGRKTIRPFAQTTYTLTVKGRIVEKELGTKTVRFNRANVIDVPMQEDVLASQAEDLLEDLLAQHKEISVRSTDEILQIDENGIHLKFALVYNIEGFYNPRIDITMTCIPSVNKATDTYQPKLAIRNAKVNVWFDPMDSLASPVLTRIAKKIIEKLLTGLMLPVIKEKVTEGVVDAITSEIQQYLTGNRKLFDIFTISDTLIISIYNPPAAGNNSPGNDKNGGAGGIGNSTVKKKAKPGKIK